MNSEIQLKSYLGFKFTYRNTDTKGKKQFSFSPLIFNSPPPPPPPFYNFHTRKSQTSYKTPTKKKKKQKPH